MNTQDPHKIAERVERETRLLRQNSQTVQDEKTALALEVLRQRDEIEGLKRVVDEQGTRVRSLLSSFHR